MAQSGDDTRVTDDRLEPQGFERLGEGEARLVIERDGVTVTVEGDEEEVSQRFDEHLADLFDTTVEEIRASVDELPMPEPDELETVPADEFYSE